MAVKGRTNNPNGRPKGSKNRATEDFKYHLNNLLQMAAPEMVDWLKIVAATDPAKALDLVTKLAEYCYPKLARQEQIVKDGDKYEDLLEKVERERKEQPTVQ